MDALSNVAICCRKLALLAAILGCFSAVAVAEQTSTAPYVKIVNEVSQPFLGEIEEAWRSIPRAIRSELVSQGWQLRAAKFVVQAEPTLVDQRPRGWPRDFTWWHTDAAHLPKQRLLIVAEKLVSPEGEIIRTDRAGRVLRHEIGHAFDYALGHGDGWESSRSTFVICYARDLQRLSDAQRKELHYYTQPGSAGRQEAFAEAFAQVLTQTESPQAASRFASAFPSVMRYMRDKVEAESQVRLAARPK